MDINFSNYNCIGILGGTFNPIHKGHSMLAKEVIEQFPDIQKLLLMPNNLPAYKDTNHIVSSDHRLNMLKLISKDISKTLVSEMEIKRGGITYTIDTLNQIKHLNDDINIYFIIGADSLYNIEKWRDYQEIFKQCTIIAAKRDCELDDIITYAKDLLFKYPDLKIRFLDTESINISSSELRAEINAGALRNEYLDMSIIQYIKDNNLYGWKQSYES